MRTIDGSALYSWLGDTMLPKCMIERSKDAEDTVLEVMQHVREMKEADGYGPHMAPSDGTEPLGVMADKNKPHPRGQVNWTKDMENAGKQKNAYRPVPRRCGVLLRPTETGRGGLGTLCYTNGCRAEREGRKSCVLERERGANLHEHYYQCVSPGPA